uniref:G-protein coupled receptors family 1 profile domain-containing protein n=1 Tax=Plectus sambesii TaxID=2011161 RepID=A0A914VM47_9BILA
MSNSSYLLDFYGPSSKYFAVFIASSSTFIVASNSLFLALLMFSPELRSNKANWFLFAFGLSDWLHGCSHFIEALALWNGTIDHRYLCTFAGHFVVISGVLSFGFPPMIATHRYYSLNNETDMRTGSCGFRMRAICGDHYVLHLIIGWYIIVVIANVPLILGNSFGEDPSGFCLLRRFETPPLLIYYLATAINTVVLSLSITGLYYYKLSKWMKEHQNQLQNIARNSTSEAYTVTKELMRLMRFISILPVLTSTPVALLTAGQMILPITPMWINRIFSACYMFTPCVTPWLTIFFVRPFRNRFIKVIKWKKLLVPFNQDTNRVSSSFRGNDNMWINRAVT